MSLRSPRRLPKRFNRSVTPATRSLAQRTLSVPNRRSRRRRERMIRAIRRIGQFGSFVAQEFRTWLVIGFVALLTVAVCVLLFAPLFDVREIRIRRQDPRIDPEEIQHILSPLFHRRLVLVTQSEIDAMIREKEPDVTSVRIEKTYPSTLTVTIGLDPVVAEVVMEDSGETGSGVLAAEPKPDEASYSYLTAKGVFVLSPIRIAAGGVPKIILTDWGVRPENRSVILNPDELQTIFLARDQLRRDFGLNAERTILYLRAKEFHIKTAKTTIWFDLSSPLSVQFQRFREFLKALSLTDAKQYIDLRITDKVIYR